MERLIGVFLVLFLVSSSFAFPKGNSGRGIERQSEMQQMSDVMKEQLKGSRNTVVARVNGSPITMGSVLKMMSYIMRENPDPNLDANEVKKNAINRLILQELAYQKAKEKGMVVDKKRIDDAIAGLRISLGGEDGFKRYLQKEMITEDDLRSEIERREIVEKIFKDEVMNQVIISEDDVKDYYKKNLDRFRQNESMIVTDIVFLLDIKEEKSMERAKEILRTIKEDIKKDLSKLKKEDDFVVRDIEIKDQKDRLRESEIYNESKKLKVGEISDVIKLSDSIHILMLKSYTPEKEYSYEEVRELVLKELRNEALIKRLKVWEEELKKDANIEIIEVKEK
jgi:parvulin-like peptidyl-prolyl isomerase